MTLCAGGPGVGVYLGTWLHFEAPALRPKIKLPILSAAVSVTTLVVHELIGVLFTSQRERPIIAGLISLLLPLAKFGFRCLQMHLLKNCKQEGFGTMLVVFEVEFFNSLYMSVFLEKVTSPLNIVLLIMVDVIENVLFLVHAHRQALKIKRHCTPKEKDKRVRQLLFQTELAVLIEFSEVLTPLIYAVWITGVQFTPNKAWIRGLETTDIEYYYNAMFNLALLALLEFISLSLFVGILTYKHQLPIFRQLHFALNAYSHTILALMCTYSLFVIAGRVVHIGNDYTFEFVQPDPS